MLEQLPFRVAAKSARVKRNKRFVCPFCLTQCKGCPLPYDSGKTLEAYLSGYTQKFSLNLSWEGPAPKCLPQPWAEHNASLKKSTSAQGQKQSAAHVPTIQDCLQLFLAPEWLSKENAWLCQSCQSYKEAQKSIQIYYAP